MERSLSSLSFSSLLISPPLPSLVVVCTCGREELEKLIYRGWSKQSYAGSSRTKFTFGQISFLFNWICKSYAAFSSRMLEQRKKREQTRKISLHPFQQVHSQTAKGVRPPIIEASNFFKKSFCTGTLLSCSHQFWRDAPTQQTLFRGGFSLF